MSKGKKENLIPLNKRTKEAQREIAKKGAEASNKKQAEKRLLKDTIEMMLKLQPTPQMVNECAEKFGFNPKDLQDIITGGLINKAMSGDSRAFEVLRDTVGQKPKEVIEATNTNANIDIKDEKLINEIIQKAKQGK